MGVNDLSICTTPDRGSPWIRDRRPPPVRGDLGRLHQQYATGYDVFAAAYFAAR